MKWLLRLGVLGLTAMLILSTGIFAACSLGRGFTPPESGDHTSGTPAVQSTPQGDDYVEVVYFHRTQRCYGCRFAGDATAYTVETYFTDELAGGKLVFKMVDVQKAANAETVDKYGAYTSSLFIDEVVDGTDHIREVTDIWFHLGDSDEFVELVRTEIEAALESI